MGFNIVGGSLSNLAEVEASLAIRVTERPRDPLTLGSYLLAIDNGTTVMAAALAANSPIFAFRWGNANLCIPNRISMSMQTVVAFAAGQQRFEAFVARTWTGNYTGGTAATITGNNAKKRASFGTTLLTECRYSTTATLTAGGTPTLDTQPFGVVVGGSSAIGLNIPKTDFYRRDVGEQYPLCFAQNEGIVIQATVAGTGTWYFEIEIDWDEVASY